ncbi:hypothetical protein D049_4793 [Vibrio parahaemolyticus VPTS-2010]|nr:hypothetical protein D049_4793 [Vibrio parahaemolyticus VPTS-2010]
MVISEVVALFFTFYTPISYELKPKVVMLCMTEQLSIAWSLVHSSSYYD